MNEQAYRKNIERIWGNGETLAGFYTFLVNNPHLTIFQSAQVYSANPNATVCKSYDDWHEQDDRRIKRGEHGIAYYDENQPNRKQYVFDISQTYGGEQYQKIRHILTEKQLCDFVNRQNILWAAGEENESVEAAVYEYCQEHFGNDLDTDYDEEYLACLTEGVTECLYAFTGNRREPKVGSLPFDFETNFKLCIEVTNLTAGLTQAIVEEEIHKNELKRERELRREIRRQEKENEKSKDTYQQTFWDFAEGISDVGVSGAVLPDARDGQAVTAFGGSAERSDRTSGQANGRTFEQVDFGLFVELNEQSADGTADSGDRAERSSLLPARNYRLTEENFRYETGAKTRFHNNVAAIKLMKEFRSEGRKATDDEKAVLSKYVGWGGLPYAFDPDKPDWKKAYDKLKEVLSDDEYRTARNSVLTAHYTPKTIIDAVFAGLKRLGMKRGKLLEPALGIGNFIGLLPTTFDARETYGVEIDEISGSIAKLLYPETHVQIEGYEKTNFANGSFDVVVSNVPFGAYSVYDKDYQKQNFYIHNYFVAKSIDKVRPGGIVAVITTKGTLDKADPTDRQYFANRAKLLGAIRLPNNAFKTSAGTEVTADILFFQRREHIVEKAKDSWINVGEDANGVPVNQYYIDHPEMLLGTMVKHKSMYGRDDETELLPDERELGEALAEAVYNLPENVYDETKEVKKGKEIAKATIEVGPNYENVKNYCFLFVGGTLYQRTDDQLIAQEIARSNVGRMSAMIDLRVQIRHILDIQLDNCSDEELQAEQMKLNRQYDGFVRNYGLINSRLNRGLFRDDADFALLISIEEVDETKGTAKKTDIFSKRTIKPYEPITSCDNAVDALAASMSEKGCVDLAFIERLTGKPLAEIKEELVGKIYRNPVTALLDENDPYKGWEPAAEYLSGNVRVKLAEAEQAAAGNEDYRPNVEALRVAQPAPLSAAEISVRIGANWIPAKYYQQFICHMLGVDDYDKNDVHVSYKPMTGEWQVTRNTYLRYNLNANSVYGTKRMDAYSIMERCLNLQTPTITDEIEEDGKKKRVTNKQETIAVREKQRKLQDAFKAWIFDDAKRREELVAKYNELFNTTVVPKYDGSHLQFPGMNPEIKLKDYQKDAVARILQGENVLLHHVVGAGKTYEMAAACMKMRQIGLARKPLIVVPNHLVVQWANEFRALYPTANIMMASKKDFEKTNRKRFVAKVATGDWDCVIMAMSSFEKIPVSAERQKEKLAEQIAAVEATIYAAKQEEGKRVRVKDLQRTLMNKKAQLEKLKNAEKKDDLLKFEDLGIDYLCVDEAHKYKNKFIFTKQNNVAGISKAMSQRAEDMDMKCGYIGEMRGGDKGVTFATGTPISNSLVEMYTMQTFLQRGTLNALGMQYFDVWAANFTETVQALEIAPSGQGYRTRTRVAKFINLPELLKLYRSFADVKTAEMLDLPTPEAVRTVVRAQPSEEILELNEQIVERAKRISEGLDPRVDNMLCVTHDGKAIALDPRCFDKTIPDNPNNKVNLCVEKVYGIWRDTAADRSAQVVFCDMSTPKVSFAEYDPEKQFDCYNDIKSKLVAMGVPKEEIAYIHDAKTDLQKQEIFDKVRRGEIRVLIGSTEKCGAGTNVQQKLIALHHLDTPYRPSDLEQREGRIIRQGNDNKQVQIFTYVTEKTFDAYSYQLLETKQRFISQINNGSLTIREADDIDETTLSYAEIKAITSANPKIKRKFEIEQELGRLSALEFEYRQNRYRMQDNIENAPKDIAREIKRISDYTADIARRDEHKAELPVIGKTPYEKRTELGAAILSLVKSQKYIGQKIGTFCGFDIVPEANDFCGMNLSLVGAHKHNVSISDSDVGVVMRMEHTLNGFEDDIQRAETHKADYASNLQTAKKEVDKPFEYSEQVGNLKSELAEIELELDLDRKETIVLDNETGDEEQKPEIIDEREEESEYA